MQNLLCELLVLAAFNQYGHTGNNEKDFILLPCLKYLFFIQFWIISQLFNMVRRTYTFCSHLRPNSLLSSRILSRLFPLPWIVILDLCLNNSHSSVHHSESNFLQETFSLTYRLGYDLCSPKPFTLRTFVLISSLLVSLLQDQKLNECRKLSSSCLNPQSLAEEWI